LSPFQSGAPAGHERATLVFDTTTAALWAEEVANEARIPTEIVPAPADAEAKCDLALETLRRHLTALEAALQAQAVPYRRWST